MDILSAKYASLSIIALKAAEMFNVHFQMLHSLASLIMQLFNFRQSTFYLKFQPQVLPHYDESTSSIVESQYGIGGKQQQRIRNIQTDGQVNESHISYCALCEEWSLRCCI